MWWHELLWTWNIEQACLLLLLLCSSTEFTMPMRIWVKEEIELRNIPTRKGMRSLPAGESTRYLNFRSAECQEILKSFWRNLVLFQEFYSVSSKYKVRSICADTESQNHGWCKKEAFQNVDIQVAKHRFLYTANL